MTKTIIPSDARQEKRMANPGKNNIFVGSRQVGPMEASRTKQASIKNQNPEFFKRQSDRKHADMSNENVGRGIGCIGANDRKNKDNMANQHQKNVGNDPGRGVGQIGRDQGPFQMK